MSLRTTANASHPVAVKVFGERNCGTNVFAELLAANTELEVLPGSAPRSVLRVARRLPRRQHEELVDAWHSLRRRRTLGWKHAYIDDEMAKRLADDRVVGVAMAKHPLAWLTSLRRNAYHLGNGSGDLRMTPLRRECLPFPVDDVRDLWALKHGRYVELADRGLLTIVRFEDVTRDPAAALQAFLDTVGLERSHDGLIVPDRDVKGSRRTPGEIAAYYAEQRWREELEPGDLDWARSIDTELLTRLRYQADAP